MRKRGAESSVGTTVNEVSCPQHTPTPRGNGLVGVCDCSWILLVKHFDFLQENEKRMWEEERCLALV